MMYAERVVPMCTVILLIISIVNLCHSHSNCSVVIGTRQNVFCGDDEDCKLQAQYLPVLQQWPIVELTCANQCIENNITQPYSITYTKCCKKTRCQWINHKDQILLDGQRPAESSSLSPTTATHTLSTHTIHIDSSSIVTTFTPLHTPDKTKSKFIEAMLKIPFWVDVLLIIVINGITLCIVVFLICFTRYHLNWVKAHKREPCKAKKKETTELELRRSRQRT